MKAPSVKKLVEAFGGSNRAVVDAKAAKLIRKVIHAADDRYELEDLITAPGMSVSPFPVTDAWARKCYSNPFTSQGWRETMMMSALSEIVGGFGEESLHGKGQDKYGTAWPRYRYVNMGDTYATTLILNTDTGSVTIGCWGDLAERGLLAE
jgi:hypothetical protein